MLALIVFMLAAAPAAPPTTTVSPVTVSPSAAKPPIAATIDMAGDEDVGSRDFVAIWPALAYQKATDGLVTLSCKVDTHGLAERCTVLSEAPANVGLGRAALEMRPTFKLKPAAGPDGAPITATMAINIRFTAPKKEAVGTEGTRAEIRTMGDVVNLVRAQKSAMGNPMAMRKITMLDDPTWTAAANFDDLARAYPAKGGGVEGYAVDHCRVMRSGETAGELRDCQVIKEEPADRDFGKAALGLATKFRVLPAMLARAPNGDSVWVDIPMRLSPPAELAERTVTAPIWVTGIDPRATPKLFPPEAVASGLTTGRGVARCTVAADGSLAACVPEPGDPEGLGFSEAAAKLASGMKMNLWSADAAPVEGGVVHIPVRLNLKGG